MNNTLEKETRNHGSGVQNNALCCCVRIIMKFISLNIKIYFFYFIYRNLLMIKTLKCTFFNFLHDSWKYFSKLFIPSIHNILTMTMPIEFHALITRQAQNAQKMIFY